MMAPAAASSAPGPDAMARLVSIDISHEHVGAAGGPYGGIALAPSPATARRLRHYGLVLRARPDGADIFYKQSQAKALAAFMKALPQGIRDDPPDDLFGEAFLFTMELKDPLFFNYTETPTDVRAGSPCLLLSNRRTEGRGEQTAALAIGWDDPDNLLWPHDPRPWSQAGLSGELLKPSARERLAAAGIRSPDGGTVNAWWMESAHETAVARHEVTAYEKSTLHPPFGLIQIFANAPAAARAGRKPGEWTGYPVDLLPPADLAGDYDAEGYLRPTRYLVSFPARATFWRYHVAGRSDALAGQQLSIADAAGAMRFEAAGMILLPDGTAARSFAAGASEKLRQRPTANYSLLGQPDGGARPRVLVQRLPAPTPDSILPDSEPDPPRIWSDIYVFV